MILVYSLIIVCILLQAERGIFDTLSFLRLFRELSRATPDTDYEERKLYVIIPILREQDVIEETILRICSLDHSNFTVTVVIACTVREEREGSQPTTKDLICNSIEDGILARFKDQIRVVVDDSHSGNMATQLNFAIETIAQSEPSDCWYLIYNADSTISEKTFRELGQLLEKNSGEQFAFQQPTAFVRDLGPESTNFTNAMSLFQTWYCLGHESRLIRKYASSMRGNLGVIIGHGSGMTLNLHNHAGGYPTQLLTEDLTFGFILSANKVPIRSLLALELADVPTSLSSSIRQKSVWFWNYLGYLSCYRKLRKKGFTKFQLVPLLWQGLAGGAYWFLSAGFILTPLILSLVFNLYWFALISLLSFGIFCIAPTFILFRMLPNVLDEQGFVNRAESIRRVPYIKLLPSITAIFLTDSVGPWIAGYRWVTYLRTGRLPYKYKTGD